MVDKDAREAHYTPCRKSELAGISLHFTLMDKNFSVQNYLQGDPNQNFRFQMTVPLSVCISDPMLVKPKCV